MLLQCHKGIAEIGGQLANVNNLLANQGSEAESYPDLLRARDAVATGQMDPLKQVQEQRTSHSVVTPAHMKQGRRQQQALW